MKYTLKQFNQILELIENKTHFDEIDYGDMLIYIYKLTNKDFSFIKEDVYVQKRYTKRGYYGKEFLDISFVNPVVKEITIFK